MTQNGPYPGPPSQPWSNRAPSDEPYTEPADPWGDHPTSDAAHTGWSGQSAAMPPAQPPAQPQFGAAPLNTPPPSWGPPVQPARRKRNTPIVALVVVLGLLICGGLGTTAWLISRDDPTDPVAQPTTPATTSQTNAVTDPEPRSSEDARFVKKGQCVRNEGTPDQPEMKIVACASGTFEVLKRVDGRTSGEQDAERKCTKVTGYTKWFFYDSELDSLDFVLCLKER
ncbi:hypothetical protein AB0M20_08825 [Actinoplanes sp. NPDC051633]|uniref:LppU/SCO3897 family protein n=1 Tax=Actinoplanes sp. NPDC051633 TaxID=3155670 RepID=UPI003418E5BD